MSNNSEDSVVEMLRKEASRDIVIGKYYFIFIIKEIPSDEESKVNSSSESESSESGEQTGSEEDSGETSDESEEDEMVDKETRKA